MNSAGESPSTVPFNEYTPDEVGENSEVRSTVVPPAWYESHTLAPEHVGQPAEVTDPARLWQTALAFPTP